MKIKAKAVELNRHILPITTDFIKLDSALKLAGIAGTGGQAKMIIEDGLVRVNGEKCLIRGKKLREGDSFEYERDIFTVTK